MPSWKEQDMDRRWGPRYNIDSAPLRRFRHGPPIKERSRTEIVAYAMAVEAAIKAAQRSDLLRTTPAAPRPRCASGTSETTGIGIHKAIRARQSAALLAAPSVIRRARKPQEWKRLYDEAMAQKRAAETRC